MSSFVDTSPLIWLRYSLFSSNFIIIHEYENFVCTNAYKLQASLSKKVVVDGHDCHTALKFGVKAKENQDKILTIYLLPNSTKKNL